MKSVSTASRYTIPVHRCRLIPFRSYACNSNIGFGQRCFLLLGWDLSYEVGPFSSGITQKQRIIFLEKKILIKSERFGEWEIQTSS